MKITKRLCLLVVFSLIVLGAALETEIKHKKNKNSQVNGQPLRPNIADLNNQAKIIRPLLERPFIPQEVERLVEPKRKIFGDDKTKTAILVGPTEKSNGQLDEKPAMYSTVIQRHATSVVKPVPQPVGYAMHPEATRAFGVNAGEIRQEVQRLQPGAYSIPVKIEGGAIKDPTLAGYETPNFISKGEKKLPQNNIHSGPVNPEAHMQQSIQKDIETFISQFDNAKDKAERTQVSRLAAESQQLATEVEAELQELLLAKEIAVKMHNLMANYHSKMRKDELSKLKLADVVTIKNILKDKLHRELQGFRTSPSQYRELEAVNPTDITRIISEIKLKIGN